MVTGSSGCARIPLVLKRCCFIAQAAARQRKYGRRLNRLVRQEMFSLSRSGQTKIDVYEENTRNRTSAACPAVSSVGKRFSLCDVVCSLSVPSRDGTIVKSHRVLAEADESVYRSSATSES